MTPEDWKRIKQVAGDAWAQPVSERDVYVYRICGDDERLRLEVLTSCSRCWRPPMRSSNH